MTAQNMLVAITAAVGCAGCCAGWPSTPQDENPPPPSAPADRSPWRHSESVDDLTRRPISTMETFGFHGEDQATLTVREHPRSGTDVFLTIERGQVECHPRECRVEVAFDDDGLTRWTGAPEDAGDGTTVFVRRAGPFLQRLRRAHVVRVELVVHGRGAVTFLFPGLAGA